MRGRGPGSGAGDPKGQLWASGAGTRMWFGETFERGLGPGSTPGVTRSFATTEKTLAPDGTLISRVSTSGIALGLGSAWRSVVRSRGWKPFVASHATEYFSASVSRVISSWLPTAST